ncbi:uncharacterized protein LOC142322914 [Lycorma delicatula]|uniref:uncharacterized protein LOC142322914 n=1 Tax=Lycorma delicatula TaxID=130591 RepID=UPI003F50E502
MSEQHTMLSVVLISLLIFVFFKFCLGEQLSSTKSSINIEDNIIPTSGERPINGSKCPPGFVYNTYTRHCKELLLSNKKFTDRLLLLMPYFAQQVNSHR